MTKPHIQQRPKFNELSSLSFTRWAILAILRIMQQQMFSIQIFEIRKAMWYFSSQNKRATCKSPIWVLIAHPKQSDCQSGFPEIRLGSVSRSIQLCGL